jgi:YfiR/HmsC-like
MKSYFRFISIVPLIVFCSTSQAQTTNYKTYSVFLYSFAKYIEWPAEKKQGDLVIAVFGNQKMLSELQASASSRKAGSQNIKIIEVKNLDEMTGAHIVFIGDAKSSATLGVAERFKGQPILIVTERDGLIKKGAGISFVVAADNSLKFQMSDQALAAQKLKAATALAMLAYKGS